MKRTGRSVLTICTRAGAALLCVTAALLVIRFAGKTINGRTPGGGINESMYVEINGTEQWVSIYGENTANPVLLYLHGGPGSSTSAIDYAFTRKWADVYTVVTWDQRNCGKSFHAEQNETVLTKELFMQDGKALTEFLLDYMGREKLTILGHSWGSCYGANLVLAYPEYYDCFIGTGQLVDIAEDEAAFKEKALKWAQGDAEAVKLVEQLTPGAISMEHFAAKNALLKKYGYDMMVDGADYNLISTIFFHPYYSISDWIKYFQRDMGVYLDFLFSDEINAFSLKGRLDYEVPYFNINGDRDYQTNFKLAQAYFDQVRAPYKQMFVMKDTTHGLLESKSELFSDILHEIAAIQKDRFIP